MAVPSTRSVSYDAVLSLSLEYMRPGLVDNVFTSTPFMAALYGAYGKKKAAKRGVRVVNGGERIRAPLLYGKNTTVGSYSGYDQLDVTPQDGITAAFYTWKQLAVSISISRKEERQNAGEGKIKDLLQSKIMQAELSIRDEMNLQLLGKTVASGIWSAGAGIGNQTANADFLPIFAILPKNQAQSVSIGNINGSTYSWWQHRSIDAVNAAAVGDHNSDAVIRCNTWVNIKRAMRRLYNYCGQGGGGFPDLVLSDQISYENYEAALDDKVRYVNDTSGPASLGFESIRFKGANMVWDEYMPDVETGVRYDSASWATGTMMMMNTMFWELVVDSGTNFITTPFVRPENQDAKVAQILLMGEQTCVNKRKQGVLFGMETSVTS